MANQITVNSGTGNITVTTSRSVIGTVANVASANVANYAANVTGNAQPNITSVGNLTGLTVTGTTTTGNLVVTGNLQVGNLVANNANYANFAGIANIANTVAGANVTGTVANATYAVSAGSANSATVAASANSVAGANVTGTVANATFASTSNVSNSATVAASANSVALANVSGAGNIASINLDGSASNVLYGNGVFAPVTTGNVANANYANFAGTAFSVSGSNVSGAVANATFATSAGTANSATVAASANSVAGANVSGTVANATFATSAGTANTANTVTDNAQPNITSVGTLSNLAVSGNITANTVTANYLVGNVSLTNIDSLYFDTAAGVTLANVGQVAWDDGDGTLQLLMKGGNVTQQIGTQEYARVYNAEATTLNKGEVVYVFGAQGNRLSVKRAQANAEATSFGTVGFVAETIASGSEGYIITSGALYKLNTNGLTAGNAVYLSPSVAGGYTTTKPVAPNQLVVLGWIERVSATVGSIYVKVDNGYELDELHDVLITSPTAGQALVYNASNLWVNGNPNVANSALSVAGANVSGEVANANFASYANVANSANSVAVANVSGIGNIATINLDGNASNVLRGDGTFSAESGNLNANFANFAGNVTVSSQPNITSTGNLTSFQVGSGSNDTLQFVPSGSNLTLSTGNVVVAQNRITTTTAPIDAVVLPNNGFSTYTQQFFTPDGSNVATFGSIIYSTDASLGAGNAAQPASITQRVFTSDSQLANANPNSTTDVIIGTSTSATALFINQKMPTAQNAPVGVIGVMSYGHSSNQATATALYIQRRRGNNSGGTSTRDEVQANDYLGNIVWRGAGNTVGTINSAPVAIGARVDSSYGGPGNVMPIGMQMTVVNSSNTQLSHNFYANGNTAFAGAVSANGTITATNIGNVANTNFNGNGSSVLLGNGVFGSAPASTPTQIVNGNSSVSFTGAGGDLNINIDGRQFAEFNYGRQLVLTGVSGDYTNASLMKLNNGTMQIINEDLGGGLPSFEFKSYYTTGGAIAPYVFQRARGTFASPANAQSGDAIMNQTFQAYSGSGFVGAGSFGATVTNNDNAGNVRSRVELSTTNDNDGSEIKFTTDVITLEGNSAINLNANSTQASGTLFKFSGYTATALTAITGTVGQVAAVTDQGGKLAYWDTTNTRWSYVHDNSAV